MTRAHGILVVALMAGLGSAACSKANDDGAHAVKTNVAAYRIHLDPGRVEFLGIPGAVPRIVRQIAAEFPAHPPLDRDTALLVGAARVGFSSQTFDAAVAATPASGATPDPSTLAALKKFASAYARLQATPTSEAPLDDDARLATVLPTVIAAREQGLALDRINLLAEATRNDPDVVNALTPSTLGSDGSALMTYSRDNIGHEDDTWGGSQHAQVTAALARTSAALRSLEPGDVAAIRKWYGGFGGRAELAWTSSALARAYDAAGTAMTKDYFRRVQADRTAHQP